MEYVKKLLPTLPTLPFTTSTMPHNDDDNDDDHAHDDASGSDSSDSGSDVEYDPDADNLLVGDETEAVPDAPTATVHASAPRSKKHREKSATAKPLDAAAQQSQLAADTDDEDATAAANTESTGGTAQRNDSAQHNDNADADRAAAALTAKIFDDVLHHAADESRPQDSTAGADHAQEGTDIVSRGKSTLRSVGQHGTVREEVIEPDVRATVNTHVEVPSVTNIDMTPDVKAIVEPQVYVDGDDEAEARVRIETDVQPRMRTVADDIVVQPELHVRVDAQPRDVIARPVAHPTVVARVEPKVREERSEVTLRPIIEPMLTTAVRKSTAEVVVAPEIAPHVVVNASEPLLQPRIDTIIEPQLIAKVAPLRVDPHIIAAIEPLLDASSSHHETRLRPKIVVDLRPQLRIVFDEAEVFVQQSESENWSHQSVTSSMPLEIPSTVHALDAAIDAQHGSSSRATDSGAEYRVVVEDGAKDAQHAAPSFDSTRIPPPVVTDDVMRRSAQMFETAATLQSVESSSAEFRLKTTAQSSASRAANIAHAQSSRVEQTTWSPPDDIDAASNSAEHGTQHDAEHTGVARQAGAMARDDGDAAASTSSAPSRAHVERDDASDALVIVGPGGYVIGSDQTQSRGAWEGEAGVGKPSATALRDIIEHQQQREQTVDVLSRFIDGVW